MLLVNFKTTKMLNLTYTENTIINYKGLAQNANKMAIPIEMKTKKGDPTEFAKS